MKRIAIVLLGVMVLSSTPAQADFKPSNRENYPAIGAWPEGTTYFTNSKGQPCARYWKITKCW